MTARQYAADNGIEIVGKLQKMIHKREKWNAYKGEIEIESIIYYIDEAGTEISKGTGKGSWCITLADGTVI